MFREVLFIASFFPNIKLKSLYKFISFHIHILIFGNIVVVFFIRNMDNSSLIYPQDPRRNSYNELLPKIEGKKTLASF